MCGIIGYIGNKPALPFLLSGLKNLEYRGYDSCGVALLEKNKIKIVKTKGEVDLLIRETRGLSSKSTLGIGHTRWATHGKPSKINAHPHLDCTGKLAVVHNGIVENYEILKRKLEKLGHKFSSQTDTEVLAHLIEEELKKVKDLHQATTSALKQVVGAYGLAVISADFPEEIIIARLSSPLILGLGKGENLIASDQPALISWTKNLATLQDGQIARLTRNGVEIKTINGQPGAYQRIILEEGSRQVNKDGFAHFMLKEIFEQPAAIADGLRGRFDKNKGVKLGGIEDRLSDFAKASFLPIFACGSSLHAAMIAKIFFGKLADLPVIMEDATEFVAQNYPYDKKNPAVFVSQSGETADVLAVLRRASAKNVNCFGLVNIAGSSVARETGTGVYTRAGFEIGVAASKTFIAQLVSFLLWAIMIGVEKDYIDLTKKKKLLQGISELPSLVKQVISKHRTIKKLSLKLAKCEKLYILGRGLGYVVSLEAALKFKEVAYMPAEGIAIGELKHGPLALVDSKTILIFLVPDDKNFSKNINAINEASARGAKIIILTNKKGAFWKKIEADVYYFPSCHALLSVFPMVVWLQLLSYYLADHLGRPIDKPRNLAKSVTVE